LESTKRMFKYVVGNVRGVKKRDKGNREAQYTKE
jgi:hypothetical protein